VTITASAREIASSIAAVIRSRLSPTTCWKSASTPMPARRSPIYCAFVFAI
jgi:hypothetical protein